MRPSRGLPLDPLSIPALAETDVLEALDWMVPALPGRPLMDVPDTPGARAWVLGDTHGDWPTAKALLEQRVLRRGSRDRALLLGDYVDRTPAGLPQGSLVNALFLLSLNAALPERVHLLRGNHETQRQIPGVLREAHLEAQELFGAGTPVGERLEDAFGKLPLAARLESGYYLSHAGFPRGSEGRWRERFQREDEELLFQVVWNDVEGSPVAGKRGIPLSPFTEPETEAFLKAAGARLFLRGHDPYLAGQYRFHGRVLTLHTTRVFAWAGLWVASVPLGSKDAERTPLELLQTEPAPLPLSPVRGRSRSPGSGPLRGPERPGRPPAALGSGRGSSGRRSGAGRNAPRPPDQRSGRRRRPGPPRC